ncbi:kinesin-like protein KIN-10C isoform X2 [Medicago truncatula]|uniref:kinesin-like protein KIN-10C isoform X2 n=1 Tax=Medicago truncatula TaxID=3880 RepID=UPI0019672F7C|nr:kinesin-like protein KIN-10C isoform X2 [Medicago truncatula]
MASKKVRVVAKIRGFSDPDTENSRTVDWVSVKTQDSGDVTISFKEQSSSRYSVDYCYNQHDDNEMIYSREVKPLVSAAFEGFNSTVIAHGARGSGKTHLIQGSLERPGLAALATSEFLSMAEKNGKSIAVSLYEVDHQDHAVDLLNPEQPQILVLEDHGRIQFKGLSQAPVKSISEFQNLYIAACSANKAAPKKGIERAHRSHIGLIVHVFSQNESMNGLVSKMNFVDMAGYEDARRKSSDASGHVENNKLNKSIYALLNVCQALSTNESRVPFRESKLTRMLQDSLRGTSKVLLVSCLNPSFCQDTVYMVSLASRSCQSIHQTPLDSMKKTASSTRQIATWDSTKKSASSAREIVTLDSTKKNASSARKIVTLDSTKKNASSVRQNVATDSSNKKSSSVRQTVTLDSTKKSASLVRQNVASDSSKKISSSVRQTVTLDSTKKSASSAIQTVTSDSTKKTASSARQTVASDSTKKTASSAIHTVASDSTKKSASSAIQIVASNSTKKSANSAILTVTYRKKKIPQSVSASTTKLPGSISHIKENGVIATNSAIKGRKLFDEASHSAVKAEKEISIADVTRASESLLDNSLSEDGNHDELNSRVEKDNSSLNASSEVEFDPTVEKVISSEDKHPYIINYSKDLSIADEGHNMNKENNNLIENEDFSPPISSQLRELQSLVSSTPLCMQLPENECISHDDDQISAKIAEPTTLDTKRRDVMNTKSPWETFNKHGSEMENSTEITEPRTPDAGRGDVMNTKSPWETFNMNGSRMKNSTEITEPRTPDTGRRDVMNTKSPWETFNLHGSGMKNSLVKDYLRILNTAEKDELKKLKGIGEKRATYILELREESPEPFKSLDDLKDIGLSEKQIKGMMKKEVGELFN